MNNLYEISQLISKYSPMLKGVFTISDLKNLFNINNDVLLFRNIKKLIDKNILKKFSRGFYITPDFSLEVLASKINESSYISFGNIFSRELIAGSVPKYTVTCVKTGRNRIYRSGNYKIIYLSIAPHLYFGYTTAEGVNFAVKEKAFIDTLYFYLKGSKFSFNIYEDINIKKLDINIVNSFLKSYKNIKFLNFVKRYLDERF